MRSPLDFAGGLFLIAIAAVGFAGTFSLPLGQLSDIGAGMMPKIVAVLVGGFGCVLILQSFIVAGDGLARWGVRGPLFLLSAALLFAVTIRPLGFVVAGPLVFLVAALADRSTRMLEATIAAIVATLFCGLLFKELLGLPIPFDPHDVLSFLHGPYDALKVAIRAAISR